MLSSVAETSHELLIRLLADRRFVASSTGADMAEKLAYIVGVRNRPDEIGKLLDAVAALRNPARRRAANANRAGHRRRAQAGQRVSAAEERLQAAGRQASANHSLRKSKATAADRAAMGRRAGRGHSAAGLLSADGSRDRR